LDGALSALIRAAIPFLDEPVFIYGKMQPSFVDYHSASLNKTLNI
jgi:hypothetical protein